MTLTQAARAQMAELEAHRSDSQRENLEADTADRLERLAMFDHCFTTWQRAGQAVGRHGIVVGFDPDERTIRLLEVTPDAEVCDACGRIPRPQRVETRTFTVAYADVTEVHPTDHDAVRNGWGLRLLGAVQDGRTVSSDRSRQLLAWVAELGRRRQ